MVLVKTRFISVSLFPLLTTSKSLAGGADSVRLSGTFFATGSDFKLGAGGDTITFASGDNAVGLIGLKGGDGSDVVNISAAADIGGTFALGAGADTFSGDAALSASGAAIKMGAGKDSSPSTPPNLPPAPSPVVAVTTPSSSLQVRLMTSPMFSSKVAAVMTPSVWLVPPTAQSFPWVTVMTPSLSPV